jgi:hypothetical protein
MLSERSFSFPAQKRCAVRLARLSEAQAKRPVSTFVTTFR